MLAFVHIEKAAGTTLIHILRKNYLFRYMDVRPLTQSTGGFVSVADMKILLRINPFLQCIAGHAVCPHSDLSLEYPTLRYITLLRNPVKRYISQYRYWNRCLGKNKKFEMFLDHEASWNFQSKKIAGCDDLSLAKEILSSRFLLVGVVEEFDEFLMLLKKKLLPYEFDPHYIEKNIASCNQDSENDILEKYESEIRDRNETDIALYEHVKHLILPRQREKYRGTLLDDVRKFESERGQMQGKEIWPYADYALRKCYYGPVTSVIRNFHGMPMSGSYQAD